MARLDYWSTPNETLSRSKRRCEDYASLKMALLARLGRTKNAMENRSLLKATPAAGLFHAVLFPLHLRTGA